MKRYTRFSIAALMCLTAVLAILLARYTSSASGLHGYTGVWQVDHGVDNTAYSKSKTGINTMILVDTQDAEIVLTSNRLFFVSSWKTTGYEILDFELGDETKLKLRELNSGIKTYAMLKRAGPKLSFAFVDASVTQIDESANGNQIVYTAQRSSGNLK